MSEKPKWEWEELIPGLGRVKIDEGWIYNTVKGSVFIPNPEPCHCCGALPKPVKQ